MNQTCKQYDGAKKTSVDVKAKLTQLKDGSLKLYISLDDYDRDEIFMLEKGIQPDGIIKVFVNRTGKY